MSKHITLKALSDILSGNASMLEDCEVVSIGVGTNNNRGEGEWDYIFYLQFNNGTEHEIRIPKTL